MNITYRAATVEDIQTVTALTQILYEDRSYEYLLDENKSLLSNDRQAVFLAFDRERAVGFSHCSLRRDYVEGTDGGNINSNVGYLEGIFVLPEYRSMGIARNLAKTCENWAYEHGCTEFASDCELENSDSLKFHLKIGFYEASRNIHFVKKL